MPLRVAELVVINVAGEVVTVAARARVAVKTKHNRYKQERKRGVLIPVGFLVVAP